MVALQQPVVGREGLLHAARSVPRELARRLLAELTKAVAGAFEVLAPGWVGVGEQAHREADDHGLDARLEQGEPDAEPQREVHEAGVHAGGAHGQHHAEEGCGDEERRERDVAVVRDGDDEQRDDVVDDDHGEEEGAQPVGQTRPHEREHAQGEGGVGGHGHSPAVGRRPPGVDAR